MRVQSDTELATFRDWTVRVRPALEAPAQLLLLLHGWTGDEDSMWVFVCNFAPKYWILAPRAPYVTLPGGYSWRPQQAGEHDRPTFESLRPAADSLVPFVDAYAAEKHLDAAQFDTIGFSQGAVLVSTLALLYPERVRRAAVLDDKVPVEYARRSVQLLQEAGAQVTYCEDEVGHKLSLKCLHAMEVFFA